MPLHVEWLESRALLAVTLDLVGGQAILGGTNINVSTDPGSFQAEMGLDVNPANPLNVAGFSHKIGANIDLDLYYTMDGGATWNVNTINGSDDGFSSTFRFDPAIAFDADGTLYVAYGMVPNAGSTRLIVARSMNGGATLDQFTTVDIGNGLDKWNMATGIDPSTGNQAVYVAYVEFTATVPVWVAGSNDGGTTFTTPISINDQRFAGDSPQFADPAVGPNGELYVSWTDRDQDQLKVDVDLDGLFSGGDAFGADTIVTNWNRDLFMSVVPGQPQRGIFNGPVMDVDRSGGPNHGTIYIAYTDVDTPAAPTASANVYLVRSTNNGTTWSNRFVVDDGETSAGVNSTEFLPWLDVDQTTGSVNVIYYTSQGDQATGNNDVLVRLATSTDGGSTYSEGNLSTFRSNEGGGYAGDYLEYIGLAVHDGTAHGLWSFRPGVGTDLEAFTASAAFKSLASANALTVLGDDQGVTDDTILLRPSPANANFLEVLVNGQQQFAGLASTIGSILVNGLGGNDSVTIDSALGALDVILRGGEGDDTLTAAGGDDILFGGNGDDMMFGGNGDDRMLGEEGRDKLYGEMGNDNLIGGIGNDMLFGGDNNDTMFGDDATLSQVALNAAGLGNSDMLFGGDGDDTMDGGLGNDQVDGEAGNDILRGGAGRDSLFGGEGDDELNAAAPGVVDNAPDTLDGGNGFDTAVGQLDLDDTLISIEDDQRMVAGESGDGPRSLAAFPDDLEREVKEELDSRLRTLLG